MSDATWTGIWPFFPEDYNNFLNWSTLSVPGAFDTAFFTDSGSERAVWVQDVRIIGTWNISADYDFTIWWDDVFGGPVIVTFNGSGIVGGQSAEIHVLGFEDQLGALIFLGSSSAGLASIDNTGSVAFQHQSTAGGANITN